MIKRAHQNNLKVFVWWQAYPLWKVNVAKLKKLKPDGIITHDPTIKFD
jgi:hypothetical protein